MKPILILIMALAIIGLIMTRVPKSAFSNLFGPDSVDDDKIIEMNYGGK